MQMMVNCKNFQYPDNFLGLKIISTALIPLASYLIHLAQPFLSSKVVFNAVVSELFLPYSLLQNATSQRYPSVELHRMDLLRTGNRGFWHLHIQWYKYLVSSACYHPNKAYCRPLVVNRKIWMLLPYHPFTCWLCYTKIFWNVFTKKELLVTVSFAWLSDKQKSFFSLWK